MNTLAAELFAIIEKLGTLQTAEDTGALVVGRLRLKAEQVVAESEERRVIIEALLQEKAERQARWKKHLEALNSFFKEPGIHANEPEKANFSAPKFGKQEV